MREFIEYFEGGKEGVQKRFLKLILAGLEKKKILNLPLLTWLSLPGEAAVKLQEYTGLAIETLRDLAAGNHRIVTREVIEKLAVPLGFTFDEGFLPTDNLTTEDSKSLIEAVDRELCFLGGGDNTEWTPERKLRVFILIRALDNF